jgi:DNA replication protein DnaC
MEQSCPICEGTGLRIIERPTSPGSSTLVQVAMPCSCRLAERVARTLHSAQIPRRYEHCSLDNFSTQFGNSDPSLAHALVMARRFVDSYPLENDGRGLLLVGSIGVGKTHLATGVLDVLVREKGAAGLFCDYRDLLKQIQHSYNPQVAATELEVLQPVFDADVLVLDELGASKPTDWVWDTVAHILNTRYNDKRTTILTTNYPNAPSVGAAAVNQLARATREETLGDRIGDRMRSRLMEMCTVVEMHGQDFRQTVRRADFA